MSSLPAGLLSLNMPMAPLCTGHVQQRGLPLSACEPWALNNPLPACSAALAALPSMTSLNWPVKFLQAALTSPLASCLTGHLQQRGLPLPARKPRAPGTPLPCLPARLLPPGCGLRQEARDQQDAARDTGRPHTCQEGVRPGEASLAAHVQCKPVSQHCAGFNLACMVEVACPWCCLGTRPSRAAAKPSRAGKCTPVGHQEPSACVGQQAAGQAQQADGQQQAAQEQSPAAADDPFAALVPGHEDPS